MNCPPEIAEIILELLQTALLKIRAQGWAGNSQGCAAEADHVHNLPALLGNYSAELLQFYWEVERPLALRKMSAEELRSYQELWDRLSVYVNSTATTSAR